MHVYVWCADVSAHVMITGKEMVDDWHFYTRTYVRAGTLYKRIAHRNQ